MDEPTNSRFESAMISPGIEPDIVGCWVGWGPTTRRYPEWIPEALDKIANLESLPSPPSIYAIDQARSAIVNSIEGTAPKVSAVDQDGQVMVKIHWPNKLVLIIGDRYHQSGPEPFPPNRPRLTPNLCTIATRIGQSQDRR